jgi:hypothetical protein
MNYILTTAQYDVLDKIARRTKMDCWFFIEQDPSGYDYILDLEENERIDLSDGIEQLLEGLDCNENIEACDLNWNERAVLCELCEMLKIDIPVLLEVW